MTDKRIKNDAITDGFGGVWERCGVVCGLEVVRPGKVQCWCDQLEMPAADVVTLAASAEIDVR